jgi:hypothetical protein
LFALGVGLALAAASAEAQVFAPPVLLESFESPDGVAGVVTTNDPIYVGHSQSPVGVTRGASSMLLELEGAFETDDGISGGWGALGGSAVQRDFLAGVPADAAQVAAFQAVAADPSAWNLLFDVTTTADSWTNAPPTTAADPIDAGPTRAALRVGFSYTDDVGTPGFGQYNTGSFYSAVGKQTVLIPMTTLIQSGVPLGTLSSYYQLQFGGDSNRFAPGNAASPATPDPTTGAKYFIDNIRLKPATPVVPEILFNWEDGTLQGWSDAGRAGHENTYEISNSSFGAVNYNNGDPILAPTGKSLLADTSNGTGFRWGMGYLLDSDPDNDPLTPVDAGVQSQITSLARKLNKADVIQFDLVYSDPSNTDPNSGPVATTPILHAGFMKVVMGIWHDIDGTGGPDSQFQFDNGFATDALGNNVAIQNEDVAISVTSEITPDMITPDEPLTVSFRLADFFQVVGGAPTNLKSTPIPENTNHLEFAITLQGNAGQTQLVHLDNFRLLSSVALDADFDHDGDVDVADLTKWKADFRAGNGLSDADENGVTDGNDFLIWQRQLGNDATPAVVSAQAVPEPGTAVLSAICLAALGALRSRSKR